MAGLQRLPFETMAEQTGKVMNIHEIALAARFVEALDAPARATGRPGDSFPVAQCSSRSGAKGRLAAEARRLAGQLEGLTFWGFRFRSSNPRSFRRLQPPHCS